MTAASPMTTASIIAALIIGALLAAGFAVHEWRRHQANTWHRHVAQALEVVL